MKMPAERMQMPVNDMRMPDDRMRTPMNDMRMPDGRMQTLMNDMRIPDDRMRMPEHERKMSGDMMWMDHAGMCGNRMRMPMDDRRMSSERTGMQMEKREGRMTQKNMGNMALDTLSLAMGYVPMQRFGKTFDLRTGLQAGTIFPDLHKPFCGKGGDGC